MLATVPSLQRRSQITGGTKINRLPNGMFLGCKNTEYSSTYIPYCHYLFTYLQFMQPSAQPRRKYCYLLYLRTTHHARQSKQSFSFPPITQHTIGNHPHHIIEHTRNDHTQLNVIEFQSLIDAKLICSLLCAIFRYSK